MRSVVTLAVVTLFAAVPLSVGAAVAPAPSRCSGPGAEAILVRAREAFRARPQRPYVVYTFSRHEYVDLVPQFDDTYQERVWYRSRDGAALARRTSGGHAYGALEFREQRFNAALDPGPPTEDIFEPGATTAAPAEPPQRGSGLPIIGSVRTHVELDYRAEVAQCDAVSVHLRLQPRRDPDRNRLRDLWLDPQTWAVQRFVATDRLYRGVTDIWDLDMFAASMGRVDGVPVIATLHADADTAEGHETGDYRFYDISFPTTLPDWYFDPKTYRFHRDDFPDR